MKFRDLPAAQIGRLGEQCVERMLRDLGAGVVASFRFSGENDDKAPAIEFHDRRVVIPDFDVSMRGRRFSVELKTYKEPQWNRTHRCQVHGVPMRLFDEYCENEKANGTPVLLGVLEVSSGSLLVSNQPISLISPRYACLCGCGCENDPAKCEYRAKWGSGYPQWYFRRDTFTEWHKLEGASLKKLQAEHERVSHAIRRHGSERSPTKPRAFNESPPWTWACLPCNVTGVGDPSAHRCSYVEEYRINYWVKRLRWAIQDSTPAQLAVIVSRPIERWQIAKWLGPSWLASGDIE